MPVAQGTCPACGSPIEFGLGTSAAKICDFCKATVLRTDRGFQDLGKVAAIADTPSLIAVGDQGTLAGRPLEVLGRVQLDYGAGPWDEFYVAFDHGQSWGWLAYAQGRWHVTQLATNAYAPGSGQLRLEADFPLGELGYFRIAEIGNATIVSAEGELPGRILPGTVRHYADCYGQNGQFATLDYDDGSHPAAVFAGYVVAETQLVVQQLGPRSVKKVKTTHLRCPNCGGEIPKLGGDRALRVGCPYCGAVSDIAEQKVIFQQERMLEAPTIPIGSRGKFDGIESICLAYVRRSSVFDGETYSWEEFLLFAPAVGYRWLIDDPETGWSFAQAISPADVDLRGAPNAVGYQRRTFRLRNGNQARVDFVLGEIYWQCAAGEVVGVQDFAAGRDVLSRELSPNEVNWTYSVHVPWQRIAVAFGLPKERVRRDADSDGSSSSSSVLWKMVALLVVLVIICVIGGLLNDDSSDGGGHVGGVIIHSGSSSGYRGGGFYSGGK
jgi:hypothetical protein